MRVNKLLSCLFVASFICYIISAVCSYNKQVINNTDESSSKFSVTYYKNSSFIRWEDDEVFCYYRQGYGGTSCFLKEKLEAEVKKLRNLLKECKNIVNHNLWLRAQFLDGQVVEEDDLLTRINAAIGESEE